QAEDGIRDPLVTGVQTCALPIVAREPPLLDETTLAEKPNRLAIGPAVERHGQLQIGRVDSQGRARDRHPFGISRELELRARRPELVEREAAVAQDAALAALHAPGPP